MTGGPYRIRAGDKVRAITFSSTAVVLGGRVEIVYDNGQDDTLTLPQTATASDRTRVDIDSADVAQRDGYVVAARVNIPGSEVVKRAQTYVALFVMEPSASFLRTGLCKGYVYSLHGLDLGQFVEPGPGGGEGFLSWVQVFHDRAGNAAPVDYALAAANAFRKVYGVAWYYHSSATVATRSFVPVRLVGLGGTFPTGFTLSGNQSQYWIVGATVTLTADEEGAQISISATGKDGRNVTVDNGVVTVSSAATDPTPWPLLITETQTDATLRFPAITAGEATDTHSAYVLIEEWLVV